MPEPAASPLAAALDSVGDRWALLLVEALLAGPRRFGDLQEDLSGIAPNVLSGRLRRLEAEGVVVAEPYSERPPRYVYELTAAGRELADALRLLADWGSRTARAETRRATRSAAHPWRCAAGVPPAPSRSARTRSRTCISPDAAPRSVSLKLIPSPVLEDPPTRRLDPGGGSSGGRRPPRRPDQEAVYRRRRLAAIGGAALAILLIILIATAIGGGGDDEPSSTPADLGVPTTPDNLGGSSGAETESTDTETETTVTPVTPAVPDKRHRDPEWRSRRASHASSRRRRRRCP